MRDSRGTLCPNASDKVTFDISGAGTLRGLCNGDPTSLESFLGSEMQLFHGQLVLVVQSSSHTGKIKVTATSGRMSSTIEIFVE
jgi:beta-galactosidase